MTTTEGAVEETLRATLPPDLELLRPLGSGVSADVYLAREPALQRLVALKVLRADIAADAVARQRFEREAQSAARITHPHVTSIHRVGRLPDGRPYIVMEYVEGRTLADMLAAGTAFEPAAARALLAAVASALAAAHERGIVHRDVRPANVLVENRTGRAVLGDFGIAALLDSGASPSARLTAAGVLLGDTHYLSPEQARGETVVEQSDVYAFGLLAYDLLAGRGPYTARNDAELLLAHVRQEPRPLRELRPDVDSQLAALVARCLAKQPAQRPLAREVAARLAGTGASAVPDDNPFAHFLAELRRRRVYQVLAAYTAFATIVLGMLQPVADALSFSRGVYRAVVMATLAGFPLALVLAWLYDIRAGRIQRTRDERPGGRARLLVWGALAVALVVVAVLGWLLLGGR